MARVLVTEKLAEAGLDLLRNVGHEVDVQLGLDADQLLEAIVGADAIIIRSATQVTADVFDVADQLKVVGRAGVGLDNIDTEAATKSGVIVANAPTSNSISAAEHTMALLLASARNVPQANAALKEGRWERSNWAGVELHDKTLGIIGLGNIGGLVAGRAHGFGMRLVGYDPFVSAERAHDLGVELLELDEVIAQADFLTLHLAKTPETMNLIDEASLKTAKPTLRVINVARGGIINEADLAAAITDGIIAGAALDVFDTEPKTESPLFGLPQVVATPHLGASTSEAQERAGETIAEQVKLALDGDFVPFAVNVAAQGVSDEVRPFLTVAEQLGNRFTKLVGGAPFDAEVVFAGEIGGYDCRMAELAVIKGLLTPMSDQTVSYVNAEDLAATANISVSSRTSTKSPSGYINGIKIEGSGHQLAATLTPTGDMRIIAIDGVTLDIPPADHLLVILNEDTPGIIGQVGTTFGDAGLNIDDMYIGRGDTGDPAMMVIATKTLVPDAVSNQLSELAAIRSVTSL